MAGTVVADTWKNGDGTENYKCRAWVNFNGTGTVAIRASGNVSSITDNGTGLYTINFITPMPNTNYSLTSIGYSDASLAHTIYNSTPATNMLTGSVQITSFRSGVGNADPVVCTVAIFR